MTHPSKRKGNGYEREVVSDLQDLGIAAVRVPLSGAVKGDKFDHDICVPVRGKDKKMECKRRRKGFATLYKMLGLNDVVCVRDDNSPSLVVMRLETFADLAR